MATKQQRLLMQQILTYEEEIARLEAELANGENVEALEAELVLRRDLLEQARAELARLIAEAGG